MISPSFSWPELSCGPCWKPERKPATKPMWGGRQNRRKIFAKISEPIHTQEEIANMAGVSRETARKGEVMLAEADESTKEALRQGERSIHSVYQELRPPSQKPPLLGPVRPNLVTTSCFFVMCGELERRRGEYAVSCPLAPLVRARAAIQSLACEAKNGAVPFFVSQATSSEAAS